MISTTVQFEQKEGKTMSVTRIYFFGVLVYKKTIFHPKEGYDFFFAK